jgi:aspartyl-tRNA(Asn)/glutamyl-tRNA(Gln) amidotransferase subunit C
MEIDVKQIADLAKLKLTKEDENSITRDLESILGHMNNLLEVDVEGVAPTFSMGDVDCLRLVEDVPHEGLSREVVLESAPLTHDGYFKVPREPRGS